jgi:hypothetical protein
VGSVEGLERLANPFELHLRAENESQKTVETAVVQLIAFLVEGDG